MSNKKEVSEDLLKEKYAKQVAVVQTRLQGTYKNRFYNQLQKTGDSEARLLLYISKNFMDNNPEWGVNRY